MRYIVFGSGGFLGKTLVSYIRENKGDVIAVSRKNNADYIVDITLQESFEALNNIDNVDVLINCASLLPDNRYAINDAAHLKALYDTNVIGAVNILYFAALKGIKKVINCSTLSVVNKPWPIPLTANAPTYPLGRHVGYSSSKLAQELVMNEVAINADIQLIHLRLSALYGPGMPWVGILPLLVEKAIKGEKVSVTNGDITSFDFLHILDLSKIILHLSTLDHYKYNIINVGSGEEIFLSRLIQLIVAQCHSNSFIENSNNDLPVSRAVIDIDVLKEIMNERWQCTSLENGVAELIAYYRNKN
jgi:UDP-glucose 4-epimerase